MHASAPVPFASSGFRHLAGPAAGIERRLGIPDLWPLTPTTWDEDTFFGASSPAPAKSASGGRTTRSSRRQPQLTPGPNGPDVMPWWRSSSSHARTRVREHTAGASGPAGTKVCSPLAAWSVLENATSTVTPSSDVHWVGTPS
ncbi:hypothetical protein E5082_30500 [Streptomyces griseoluteus]|uniref:Uncharacterized protein n=1 Tax=Streptomyces griseoluteus TaxID=29306 RepID=A0A4Z1CZA9_STRGP|nr:hypothetical protein E5082_30500 [Streptomyces griseoluteus]